jgi:hypothetical protein
MRMVKFTLRDGCVNFYLFAALRGTVLARSAEIVARSERAIMGARRLPGSSAIGEVIGRFARFGRAL